MSKTDTTAAGQYRSKKTVSEFSRFEQSATLKCSGQHVDQKYDLAGVWRIPIPKGVTRLWVWATLQSGPPGLTNGNYSAFLTSRDEGYNRDQAGRLPPHFIFLFGNRPLGGAPGGTNAQWVLGRGHPVPNQSCFGDIDLVVRFNAEPPEPEIPDTLLTYRMTNEWG